MVAAPVRTDLRAARPYLNLTTFLVEKPAGLGEVLPGLTIPGEIDKVGYKGVDTTELVFDGFPVTADAVLGGTPGRGFAQMMDGVEVGRVNVAARGCGIAIRAFELAISYAQPTDNKRTSKRTSLDLADASNCRMTPLPP